MSSAAISIFDAIKRRDQNAAANFASSTSPDAIARANVLSRQMGVPADFADRNLSAVEQQFRAIKAREAIVAYPTIGKWGDNPRYAAMAADDLDSFKKIGRSFTSRMRISSFTNPSREYTDEFDPEGAAARAFSGVKLKPEVRAAQARTAVRDIIAAGVRDASGQFTAEDLSMLPKQAGRAVGAGVVDVNSGLYGVGRMVSEVGDQISPFAWAERKLFGASIYGKLTEFFSERQREGQALADDVAGAPAKARIARDVISGFRSVPTSAAALGLSAMGAPQAGAGLLGASVAGGEYGRAREKGIDPVQAAIYAASQGAVEFATERVPALRYFEDTKAGASFARKLINNLGSELPQEQIATVVQDLNEWAILNPEKPFADYLKERPNAALSTAIATAVGSSVTVGTTEAIGSLVTDAAKVAAKRQEAQQAEADAAFLDDLANGVVESKTAKRDPSAFAAFLALQADGTPVENLYIPADKLVEFFQSNDMDYRGEDNPFSFDSGFGDQVEEAFATGGDVVVKTSDFAAHVAGTPAWEALKEHVRLSPGGVSLAEARSFAEAEDAAMEAMGEEYAKQVEAERAATEPRQKLYQSIRDKLTNAGFTQSAADTNAALLTARYATRAARTGKELTGAEFDSVAVNQVLPERLAPIVAADQLDIVIDAMKRDRVQRSDRQKFGPSLLEWIAAQGGIEDRGGDLASMGADQWHRGKPGRRKLIRAHAQDDPSFLPSAQQNANTPDELALRAQEAGYFPVGERPSIDQLFEAIDAELRGKPSYAEDRSGMTDQVREAADELAALLEQEGLDPATASKTDVRKAVERYQSERMAGRGYDQALRSQTAIAFTRDLDAIKAGTADRGLVLKLGLPSPALRAAGLPALPILYRQSEAAKTLIGKHKDLIDEETLRRLPEALADPALVFTQPNGRFAVIIEDADGSPVLASIEPKGVVGTTRGNLVVTVHPKSSDVAIVKAIDEGRVTYADEGRSQQWFDQAQRQLPGREPTADETDIAKPAEKRKPDRPILSIRTKRQLKQSFMDGPRGRVTFTPDGKSVIDLFQARDPSTFLHESAHIWLEELRQDAESPGAADQINADWETVKQWAAANGHPIDTDIPVEAHELWARGVERFVMEGKAPSTGLRKVFDTFRAWLLNIYQVVANLRSPITPEIRDVMARLLATDAEIEEARDEQQVKALWSTATAAGMTEQVFAEYQKLTQEARDEAHDALLFKTMAKIRRERTKAWKEERDAVRAEVAARVDARPEFRALKMLRAKEPRLKLDRAWLVENYGQDILATLPGGVPPIYAETNTTPADEIAELSGFATGDDMVRTLISLGQRRQEMQTNGDKRSVREALIEDETAAVMAERHGDPLSDGSIEEEALALIHNEKQGEVIASELRELGRRSNRQATPYALARQWAAETIARSKVSDSLSGTALQRYARAARNAAKLAEEAMLAGNVDETYRQKQRQMLNNALIAEATKAKDLIDAAVTRLSKVAKRATMKGVAQDYLDQAHAMLEDVSFRQRTQRSIDRQESFEAWAEQRRAEGHDVVVPASFAATLGTTHWSRLDVEKLLGLKDAVDQIIHLGRHKQTLIDNQERREFDAVVAEAVDSAGGLRQRPPASLAQPGFFDAIRAGVESWDTALLKVETIVDWLDQGKADGVFNRIVFKPIAAAQDREADMLKDYQGRVVEAMKALPEKTIRRWQEKVDTGLGGPFGGPTQRQQLIAMALNMGNEGNIQRLTDGYGWSEQAVWDALERELRPEDWQFVQQVWDIIDGLWPQIEAMEKRINGIAPEKVEPKPRLVGAVALRGGYYPAIYDTNLSIDAEVNAGKESDLFEAVYTRANTTASATKARAQKVKRPILLQLGVINRHLGEVIHDITHREAVMQADKFLSDRRVIAAIDSSLGPEYRKMFRPWLKFIANQWAMERAGNEGIAGFLAKLRTNTTVVGMGFRITTILTQVAGYSNSFEYVGAKWVSGAIAQTARHPIDAFNFVMERSGEVRNRMDTIDRDVREGIARLAGKAGFVSEAKRFAFHGIGLADRMVVIPTWLGAYNKAIASGASEDAAIYEADKAVRLSQGAGAAKDMAAVQRGTGKAGELLKYLTMFYSYMSAFYQRQRNFGRDVRDATPRDLPEIASRAFWLFVVPPLLVGIMTGNGPDEDEDWAYWAFREMLLNALGPIPVVRDVARPLWAKLEGKPTFGYAISPVQRAGQVFVEAVDDIGDVLTGEETKRATRNIMETVGYATGLVPGQIAASTQFLVDVAYGDQDPETIGEWVEGLTKGKIKED